MKRAWIVLRKIVIFFFINCKTLYVKDAFGKKKKIFLIIFYLTVMALFYSIVGIREVKHALVYKIKYCKMLLHD